MPLSKPAARTLLAMLLAAALAGCADDDARVDDTDDVVVEPEPMVHKVNGTSAFGWETGVGVPTTGLDAQLQSTNAMSFDVPEGAKSLTVNATWTCGMGMCGLHMYLDRVERSGAGTPLDMLMDEHEGHATGDGAASITIENPEPGEWMASVFSDGPNRQLRGAFAYEVLLPDDAHDMMADDHAHGG